MDVSWGDWLHRDKGFKEICFERAEALLDQKDDETFEEAWERAWNAAEKSLH